MRLKIVSFNLRYDTPRDGEQRFTARFPFIVRRLTEEAPDVIGFQEMLQSMRKNLRDALPEYDFVGGGRDTDRFGESSVIAFRRKNFNLNECDTFWLSPTPYLPGSRFPEDQSPCPRVCTSVSLTHIPSGYTFGVYNLHTDHEGSIARLNASRELLERIAADRTRRSLPFFVTGDFNAPPHSPEIRLLRDSGLRDLAEGVGLTFHNFGRITGEEESFSPEDCKIDYIWTSGEVGPGKISLWKEQTDGLWLSDHYPVVWEGELL